uniref:Natural resistance-associated macrophage protein n=1 Tax=Sexangularia sp. CB-2014 TaxID=1486929 RepID=A0A7S1VBS6_9EUKA|mmetsp:Transcript_14636/g.45947  ORF Transcript_14636/g.45947 Transcript_14636/m.45947 type:complete len:582 (+) Transcript_14636:112-1857(+)
MREVDSLLGKNRESEGGSEAEYGFSVHRPSSARTTVATDFLHDLELTSDRDFVEPGVAADSVEIPDSDDEGGTLEVGSNSIQAAELPADLPVSSSSITSYASFVRAAASAGVGIPPLKPFSFSWRKLWAFTGPGWLMSIAYLDPGNLEADLQTGVVAGYELLWVLLVGTCIGFCLQMLAARLGVVTGKNLAEVCRIKYDGRISKLLWIMTEVAIIGADIQEVIGSAFAINILTMGYVPLWAGVLFTAIDTFAFLFLENYGIRKLEAFFCSLIAVMAITFGVEYVISSPSQAEVLKGTFVPIMRRSNIGVAVGLIGAVIMPHNIYLHSALVQSRKVDRKSASKVRDANVYFAIESAIALLVSFIINLFVVSVFAEAFHNERDEHLDIGLSQAGHKLGARYGPVALYVWAIGLLAAGQSSTMTGTYAGQFVMEGFLRLKMPMWRRVLITRSVAIIPSVLVAALVHNKLDALDQFINVLQSIQLPFALLPVLKFTSDPHIMGIFRTPPVLAVIVWLLGASIIGINLIATLDSIGDLGSTAGQVVAYIVSVVYMIFILYLAVWDMISVPLFRFVRDRYKGKVEIE